MRSTLTAVTIWLVLADAACNNYTAPAAITGAQPLRRHSLDVELSIDEIYAGAPSAVSAQATVRSLLNQAQPPQSY